MRADSGTDEDWEGSSSGETAAAPCRERASGGLQAKLLLPVPAERPVFAEAKLPFQGEGGNAREQDVKLTLLCHNRGGHRRAPFQFFYQRRICKRMGPCTSAVCIPVSG